MSKIPLLYQKMLTFRTYIKELTVSPDYRQGNVFNPFYDMSKTVTDEVTKQLKKDKKLDGMKLPWKFKSISSKNAPRGRTQYLVYNNRSGYYFRICDTDDVETEYYIRVSKSEATGHYGMAKRKNSTASSDINELMSLYFLKYNTDKAGTEKEAQTWLDSIQKTNGDTGIVKADVTKITYTLLRELIDKDETPLKDIQIGWHNAREVEKDGNTSRNIVSYHSVPRNKPSDIPKSNPSDIILYLGDGVYTGYSNKASAGKDSTPKFNTNVSAFYKQREKKDVSQLAAIRGILDSSWRHAESLVTGTHATKALKELSSVVISADYTESNLKSEFADLGRAFIDDGLNFFADDFYYPYRNHFITKFSEHLENADNLSYFLQTISLYTFATGGTPCPYKLLVGSTTGSTIKDVSSDDTLKLILTANSKLYENISTDYDGKKQSFKITFTIQDKTVTIPVTCRTRTTGGWQGKALYIETPGVKVS